MNGDGKPPETPEPERHPAADVSLQRLGDQHGESSSQAESRASKGSSKEETRWSEDTPRSSNTTERRLRSGGHADRRSGGFLLGSSLMNGSPRDRKNPDRHGKRKAQNGHLHIEKRRPGSSRLSADSSHRGSPLSREVSRDQHGAEQAQSQPVSRAPSMDPAQLVQMALNLSESRRRHVSGGSLHVPLPPSRDSRRSSGLRASNVTSDSYKQSFASDERPQEIDQAPVVAEELPQTFSPATLSRAERARRYFELASEHRRLLEHLPPLRPGANAPGNHTFVSHSSPGSPHSTLKRVPTGADNKHELGRPYNPLQALRNRRIRTRERKALPAPPESWQDVDRISRWIDGVEAATAHSDYRTVPDRVQLPTYPGDDGGAIEEREVSKGHKRSDTASSVITRPENGWSIEPSELLADTYWTEKGDNKTLIQNRSDSPLFPKRPRQSVDKPRQSQDRQDEGVEEVPFHKRAHRGPHLLPKTKRFPKVTRSGSTTSVSTDDAHAPGARAPGSAEDDYNVGPLERHMQQMIAKDEMGELSSPDLVSPDHWDSKHTQFPVLRHEQKRPHRDALSSHIDGRLSAETARPEHRRSKSADGRVGVGQFRMSIDVPSTGDLTSRDTFPQHTDADESTFENARTGRKHKSKLSRLPLFRSHSKDRSNIDHKDFAAGVEKPAPIPSGNGLLEPRSSQESSRPSAVQRNRTVDSFSSSLQRQGTATTSSGSYKEPSSTVGRFFKGSRIGELVRNESTRFGFRNKDRPEDAAVLSDVSAVSDESEDDGAIDDAEPSPRTSIDLKRKPKYHLQNLPSFKSPMARNNTSSTISDSDPITRQQRAQREAGRSPRFDRLAPPRMNLPGDETDTPNSKSDTLLQDDRRKLYGFLGTRSQGASQISINAPSERNKNRMGKLQSRDHRHWSISNQMQPQQNDQITMRDVERAKALLLSSGIKAKEINRKANTPRDRDFMLYNKMAEIGGKDLGNAPRKDEHMVVSRALSDLLTTELERFEKAVENFQAGTAKDLGSRLDQLQRRAVDQLAHTVHEQSDDADAFAVELSTRGPQDVKRVDEAIDEILRERNRQFRLLRRFGFKLLEWLVLGIMWWVWFIVVVFKTFKRGVVAIVGFLRWLLWF